MTGGSFIQVVGAVVLAATAASAQLVQPVVSKPVAPHSSPQPLPAFSQPSGPIVREIDDPHNGDRWLLRRDPSHPAGPGTLIRVSAKASLSAKTGPEAPLSSPTIRVGDHVLIEEDSPVVEVRLEAVALNPAWAGSSLNVRLAMGGKVLHAVATAPGRVTLQPEAQR